MVLWIPTTSCRANTKKICPFQHRGLECKSRKSRDTWVTGQFGLGVQNEAGQRLTAFCQENTLRVNTLFQQHKRQLYTWISPDGQYWSQIDYILCSWNGKSAETVSRNKTGSLLWLIAKCRVKLKKVGKTTRLFRYDLNQFPYDYTLEMTNRFKGLDLIECLKNYEWRFMPLYRRQGARRSLIKINAERQNGCLRRPYK